MLQLHGTRFSTLLSTCLDDARQSNRIHKNIGQARPIFIVFTGLFFEWAAPNPIGRKDCIIKSFFPSYVNGLEDSSSHGLGHASYSIILDIIYACSLQDVLDGPGSILAGFLAQSYRNIQIGPQY